MYKKIELGTRFTPRACLEAVAKIFRIVLDTLESGVSISPPSAASHYTRQMKRVHRKACWKLQKCKWALSDMQQAYAEECFRLEVYQRLAEAVTPPQNKDDKECLKWAQWATEYTIYRLKAVDPVAQDFLIAEMAGLQSKIAVLESTVLFQSLPQKTQGYPGSTKN